MKSTVTEYIVNSKKKKAIDVFCLSDTHIGSVHCDYKAIKKALNKAKECGAIVLLSGDIMENVPSNDPRFMVSENPYESDAYFNEQNKRAFDLLSPYADIIYYIGAGNHEYASVKYHNYDPIAPLVSDLNSIRNKKLQPIEVGDYTGVFRVSFKEEKKSAFFDIGIHHGSSGGTSLSSGANMLNKILPLFETDIVWCGHLHKATSLSSINTIRPTSYGAIKTRKKSGHVTPPFVKPLPMSNHKNRYDARWADKFNSLQSSPGYLKISLSIKYSDGKIIISDESHVVIL